MKNILAFAGSSSKQSINKQLVTYASNSVEHVNTSILDLNDFELPLFSVDLEQKHGIPENAHKFLELIKSADGILLSLAEHNGAYATVFKNLLDWLSRIEGKLFFNKPMLLMATSPGGRGGASVLEMAQARFRFHFGDIVAVFSLPFFGNNFSEGKIVHADFDKQLKEAVKQLQKHL